MNSKLLGKIVLLWLVLLLAKSAADTLVSIDLIAKMITVDSGAGLKAYRLKDFTEVSVNGAPSNPAQLQKGMRVTITLSDPQTASRIAATGNPLPNTPTPAVAGNVGASTPRPIGALTSPKTGQRRIAIKGRVDGLDLFKVKNGQLWIEHKSWEKRSEFTINGVHWNVQWDGDTSQHFIAFNPPLAPFEGPRLR